MGVSGGARHRPGEGAAVSRRSRIGTAEAALLLAGAGGIPRVGDLWLKECLSRFSIASGQHRITGNR